MTCWDNADRNRKREYFEWKLRGYIIVLELKRRVSQILESRSPFSLFHFFLQVGGGGVSAKEGSLQSQRPK